jgi:tetratricopeptide (TPR) repeat protein
VLLGLALPSLATAQLTGVITTQRAPTDPKWQAGMAEDIEVLRRLLAQKLGHGRSANGLILWDADGGGNKRSAGTLTFNTGGNLDLAGAGTLTLGEATLNAAGREEPAPEGVYLKGHGVVYTVTLPAPRHEAKAKTDKPASAPLSEWDRARKELRGEKVEAPPAAPEPPSLADVILKVLAENGRHFAHLEPEESITVVVTFRGEKAAAATAAQPGGPGGMPGMAPAGPNVPGGGPTGGAPGQPGQTLIGGIPGLFDNGPPSTALDYVLLGDLHLKQRQYEQALECFKQALKRQPDLTNQSPEIHRKLAEVYLGLNQVDQARASLEAADPSAQKANRPKTPPPSTKPELPAKLIVSAPKKLLDQVGGGKMTFEEFKKAATVDSFGGEK